MNIMKKSCYLLLILTSFSLYAQQGPTVTCNNCDGSIHQPIPVTGSWFNPEQPGTGYVLEVQNGRLLGYFFGYDEAGDQQWLIFQGELQAVEDDPDVIWKVEAPFTSFRDGNSFNEPYTLPSNVPSGDSIKIEFTSINYARVSVNDGEVQNMAAFTYGVGLTQHFDSSEHLFPDLEGMWNITAYVNRPDVISQQYLYLNDIFYIGPGVTSETNGMKIVDYFIHKYFLFSSEILGVSSIRCSNPMNPENQQREVVCEMRNFPWWFISSVDIEEKMIVPLPNIGVNDFTAEYINPDDEDYNGLTIKAKRVNYYHFEDPNG